MLSNNEFSLYQLERFLTKTNLPLQMYTRFEGTKWKFQGKCHSTHHLWTQGIHNIGTHRIKGLVTNHGEGGGGGVHKTGRVWGEF